MPIYINQLANGLYGAELHGVVVRTETLAECLEALADVVRDHEAGLL